MMLTAQQGRTQHTRMCAWAQACISAAVLLARAPGDQQGLRTTYKLKTELCTRLLDFVEHNHGTPQAEEAAALAQQFWSTCQQKEADAAAHRRLRAQQQKQQKQHHQLNQQVKQQLQQQQQQQLLLLQEAQQQPAARASNTPRAASVNLGASGGRVTKRQQHKERASKAGLAGGGAASGAAGGWAPAGGASGDSSGSHGAVESLVQLQRGAQHTASGAAAAAAHTPADAAAGGGGSAGASLAHPMASPVLVMPPTLQQPLGQLLTGPSGTPMLLMCPPQTYQLQPPSQQQQQQMEYMLQTMATPQELAAANAGALAHTAALSAAGAPAAAAGGQAPPLSSAQPASAAAAAGVRASALAASATPLAPTTPQAPPASAASPAPATAPPDAAGAGPGSVAALMQAPAVLAAHSLHAAALSLNASHEATPAGLKFRCCCGGGSSRIGPASAADSSGAGPEPVQVFCVVCGVLQHAACCGIGAPAAAAAPDGAAAALAAEEPPSPLGGHMCDVCCMVLAAADSGWQLQDPLLLSPRALTMRASPQQPLQQGFAGTFFNDGPLQGTLAAQQQHAQQTQQTQRHVPQAQLRTEVLLGCMRIAHAAAAAPHTPALSAMSPPSRIRTVISTGTSRSGGAESSNALAGGAGWPYAFEWPAACSVKLNGALIDASAAVAAQPAAMPGAQPSPAVPAPTRGLISLTPSALAGSNTLEVICTGVQGALCARRHVCERACARQHRVILPSPCLLLMPCTCTCALPACRCWALCGVCGGRQPLPAPQPAAARRQADDHACCIRLASRGPGLWPCSAQHHTLPRSTAAADRCRQPPAAGRPRPAAAPAAPCWRRLWRQWCRTSHARHISRRGGRQRCSTCTRPCRSSSSASWRLHTRTSSGRGGRGICRREQ
jgi:hypothetical protein